MGLDELRRIKANRDEPKKKEKKPIPKISKKKKASSYSGSEELNRWFENKRKEMTGRCSNCGKRSSRDSNQYFKFSIAHILPKAYFKSVATHPDNWIELCFWGENSCHTNMDNKTLDLTEMSCWDEIVTKFQKLYPLLTPKEKGRIPKILKQYINTDF